MSDDRYAGLQQLGAKTEAPTSPEQAVLERVPARTGGKNAMVRFVCPEFTSLCPMTGQPDFGHIVIDYIPDEWLVESKSLKLFLHSFRNHGGFHEACSLMIADRLVELLSPKWLRIGAYWYPRGRHSHRRVLADRRPARGRLDPRPGRCALPWPGLI